MRESQVIFLGAGKANVVVDVPLTVIRNVPPSLLTSAATQRAALRIRGTPHNECAECYRVLKPYAGSRHVVPLDAALYAAIEAVVPPKHVGLIKGATEATIVPNFTNDPAQLLQVDVTAGDESGRLADYTVEVKPKSAWRQPQVVGIIVDGVTYMIDPTKHRHCRYAQMLSYKEARDSKEVETPPAGVDHTPSPNLPYCPNFLYQPALSSRDGLRRLMCSPKNNLKVISYHPSRAQSHPGDPKVLTVAELDGIADAIDASGVLAPLAHLQLCGCAPPAKDDPADVAAAKEIPVLDVELLNRWSHAKDTEAVKWVVLASNPTALCSCTASETNNVAPTLEDARQVCPLLDLAACVERFYVSTTAKDVSLMVAVSSCHGSPDESSPCCRLTATPADVGGVFVQRGADVYRVGAVDLDDKQHKSLHHYYLHDREIVEAFVRSGRS